jgi:hypothetical protein
MAINDFPAFSLRVYRSIENPLKKWRLPAFTSCGEIKGGNVFREKITVRLNGVSQGFMWDYNEIVVVLKVCFSTSLTISTLSRIE